jgi:hypothetical protein
MMDAGSLQDIINRGLGTAARAIGVLCNAYRPVLPSDPLASGNRFLQLSAAFNARDTRFANAGLPAEAVWYGVFDGAYLLPADYLVETISGRVWFVAALQSLLPATCVLTNRVLTVTRPAAAVSPGANAYGGGGVPLPILTGFNGSLLHGGSVHGAGAIPADARIGGAVALLPALAGLVILRGDLVADDLGRNYVVSGSELNELGWRLDLRQAAS